MARVVITGGSGFIGSHLAEHLVSRGDEVTVFDAAPLPPDLACPVRLVGGDIRDERAVGRAIGERTELVYHLSAVVGVDRYLGAPADVVETNLLGTLNVLRLARTADAKVVLASTSEVYGYNPLTPGTRTVTGCSAARRWTAGRTRRARHSPST